MARAVAACESLLIIGLLLKQRSRGIQWWFTLGIVIGVFCYVLSEFFRPASVDQLPPWQWYALVVVAMAIPALYWGWVRVLFLDEGAWGPLQWWVAGLYEVSSIFFLVLDFWWQFKWHQPHVGFMMVPLVMRFILIAWALMIVLMGWRVDLLEGRRRLRLWVVLLMGGYTLLALLFESSGVNQSRETHLLLIHTVFLALTGFAFLVGFAQFPALDRFRGELQEQSQRRCLQPVAGGELALQPDECNEAVQLDARGERAAEGNSREPGAGAADQPIRHWDECLQRIVQERLYAQENMTIARLAEILGVPEYRLRKQIVSTTEFNNFNQFLNHYRVAEAARRLRLSSQQHLPILTIALDVGFRSLPSFNRSFKQSYGMTPSEYRKMTDSDSS